MNAFKLFAFVLTVSFDLNILRKAGMLCRAVVVSDQGSRKKIWKRHANAEVISDSPLPWRPQNHLMQKNNGKVVDMVKDTADFTSGDKRPKVSKDSDQEIHTSKPPQFALPKRRKPAKKAKPHVGKSPELPGAKKGKLHPDYRYVSKASKFMRALQRHWKHYLKTILRKIVSRTVTNFAAGNQWRIISLTPSSGNSTLGIPEEALSPRAMWDYLTTNQPDAQDNMSAFLNQIILWAPFGPFFRRVESDFGMDLEEVFKLFFKSPRGSINLLLGVNGKFPSSPSSNDKDLDNDATLCDPRIGILLDHASGKQTPQVPTEKENMLRHALLNDPFMKDHFIMWLSTVVRQIDPAYQPAWLSICALQFRSQRNEIFTVLLALMTYEIQDQIHSTKFHHISQLKNF